MDRADIAREALAEIKADATALVLACVEAGAPYAKAQSIRLKAERALNRLDRAGHPDTLRLARAS